MAAAAETGSEDDARKCGDCAGDHVGDVDKLFDVDARELCRKLVRANQISVVKKACIFNNEDASQDDSKHINDGGWNAEPCCAADNREAIPKVTERLPADDDERDPAVGHPGAERRYQRRYAKLVDDHAVEPAKQRAGNEPDENRQPGRYARIE
ncbi:hypothetical protein SDC9_191305 [bioreactor metagenome]|uniref:Uncharacterized protein n=1 Tax=bioreactor metagenome TaxID=1076179 RepID=A0A645HXI4_9ZZZZ